MPATIKAALCKKDFRYSCSEIAAYRLILGEGKNGSKKIMISL